MTPVGLYSASREPDLPLGAHGAYKWSWCFTVHSIWGLLSAGGLQLLVNTSYKAQWHTELCCVYIDITMHAQLILCISHLFHILYMHTAHLMSLIYAYSWCAAYLMYTQALCLPLSHIHMQKFMLSLWECWRGDYSWEGDWGWAISGQLINHAGCRPLISSTGIEESSAATPHCFSKFSHLSRSLSSTHRLFSLWCCLCIFGYFYPSLSFSERLTYLMSLWLYGCLSFFLSVSLLPLLRGFNLSFCLPCLSS